MYFLYSRAGVKSSGWDSVRFPVQCFRLGLRFRQKTKRCRARLQVPNAALVRGLGSFRVSGVGILALRDYSRCRLLKQLIHRTMSEALAPC